MHWALIAIEGRSAFIFTVRRSKYIDSIVIPHQPDFHGQKG